MEVQRLRVVATLPRTHKDLLADYVNYRQTEEKLVEMEEKIKCLTSQAKRDASQANNAPWLRLQRSERVVAS